MSQKPIIGLDKGQKSALLISEVQNGITNHAFVQRSLTEQVESRGIIARINTLADAFRKADLPVIHCLIVAPTDYKGWNTNCYLAARIKAEGRLMEGTPSAAPHDDLIIGPEDIMSVRYHGMTPFTGTALDATLRRLGVDTIVLSGVSTNIALPGASAEAVGLGYQVVIAEDCTAGGTAETHAMQISMHLPLVASVTHSASVMSAIAMRATD